MKKHTIIFMLAVFVLSFAAIGVSAAPPPTKETVTTYPDGREVRVRKEVTQRKNSDGTISAITKTITITTYVDSEGYTVTHTHTETEEVISGGNGHNSNKNNSNNNSNNSKKKPPKKYKDITVKKVGKRYYSAVKKIKNAGGFNGVFTSKYFGPRKKITQRQYLAILRNLYGKDAPQERGSKAIVTEQYARNKLLQVASNRGLDLKWPGKKFKITRLEAVKYIIIMSNYSSKLKF